MLIHPLTGYDPKPNRTFVFDQVFVFVSVFKTILRYHKPLKSEKKKMK